MLQYFLIFVLIPLGLVAALALFIAAIVYAFKRRRRPALISLAVSVISLILAGSSFVYLIVAGVIWGVTTASESISHGVGSVQTQIEESRQKDALWKRHISTLKSFTDPATLLEADTRFWEDAGDADHRRAPLVYPYRLETAGSLDWGFITRYEPPAQSQPAAARPVLNENINRLRTDGTFLLYETVTGTFGILEYRTGDNEAFKSREALLIAASERGYKGSSTMLSVKTCIETPFMAEPAGEHSATNPRATHE